MKLLTLLHRTIHALWQTRSMLWLSGIVGIDDSPMFSLEGNNDNKEAVENTKRQQQPLASLSHRVGGAVEQIERTVFLDAKATGTVCEVGGMIGIKGAPY
ncbi:hypothetical protein Y032_0228g2860 [Ancylostoma ceylanicum]|uniref:Uncharacterized protein n=1 Tax=Ancylostoma ceylanicum TaxID=53326 RepID=A0A016SH80_9BILA|nr:hypothetical protein Y032_0228g2860 [Ancylostoma ceylanicum]